MIRHKGNIYKLDTPNTTLVIEAANGEAEYVYYGKKLRLGGNDYECLRSVGEHFNDGKKRLISSFGLIESQRSSVDCAFADGSFTMRLKFVRAKIVDKPDLSPLPSSYETGEGKNACKTLCMEFLDEPTKVRVFVYYTVFEDSDVISVSTRIYNGGKKEMFVRNLASLQIDLPGDEYQFITFCGTWANERNKEQTPVKGNVMLVNESRIGSSSHAANPFVILKKEGGMYAFNLVYSGNHKETAECDRVPKTRVIVGMNDYMLNKKLAPGDSFLSPEAVMCYAPDEDGISKEMHAFVNTHIVRGKWREKERPVLINNWEATYFDFDKEKLFALADDAAALGVELFVLDDGWFGHRDDDHSSLGDWFDYEKKTGGIAALAEGIREKGLKFGIWVEPESISEDSELYKKHPEFAMKIPSREPLRMRDQLMLNLADVNVQKYLVRVISNVITETKASYVKWDYNRRLTDCFSKEYAGGEYMHEFIKGTYAVLRKLVEKFPSVLFEGCAGGGGRFDLGMLCFMPQIWTSDNTDARCRMHIQTGTSYGYPQSTMGCHVSASPNHQTGKASALETRFNIAMFGAFGYELDITKLSKKEKETIKVQIKFYKKHRKLLQFGTCYRLGEAFGGEVSGFICVNANKSQAIAMISVDKKWETHSAFVSLKGLDEGTMYEVSYRKQDNYETAETFVASGELLMNAPLSLQKFSLDTSEERHANGLLTRCLVLKKVSPKTKKN
ncbi:MAG: alpha-galactosidase [Clostridia bacterium]|nr:alpha-galactosidase [Clostridia bacterium]